MTVAVRPKGSGRRKHWSFARFDSVLHAMTPAARLTGDGSRYHDPLCCSIGRAGAREHRDRVGGRSLV